MPRTNLNLFDESELLEINISRWMLRNFRNWMIPLISVLVSMTTISLVNDLSGLLTDSGDVSSVETVLQTAWVHGYTLHLGYTELT